MGNKAEQYIRLAVLEVARGWIKDSDVIPRDMSLEKVDEIWEAVENSDCADDLHDAKAEIRGGEVETGIESEWSRHYESKSVAACIRGQWVGWTYWFGGGKHGEPESIDWMEDAYLLNCEERQEVVTLRDFTKEPSND